MDMTQDQEKRVRTLRRELEGWREVLCALHSLLIWEKHYYPAISVSAVTTFFMMIWYIEPSILTLFSVLGIIVTLADYLVPQVVPWVVGADSWTGTQERRYEHVITTLASLTGTAAYVTNTLRAMKDSKPRTYFVVVTGCLLFCAWIGSNINNLLLTYFMVVFMVLLPGLKHQGILKKYFASALKSVAGLVKSSVSSGGGGGETTEGEAKKKD